MAVVYVIGEKRRSCNRAPDRFRESANWRGNCARHIHNNNNAVSYSRNDKRATCVRAKVLLFETHCFHAYVFAFPAFPALRHVVNPVSRLRALNPPLPALAHVVRPPVVKAARSGSGSAGGETRSARWFAPHAHMIETRNKICKAPTAPSVIHG